MTETLGLHENSGLGSDARIELGIGRSSKVSLSWFYSWAIEKNHYHSSEEAWTVFEKRMMPYLFPCLSLWCPTGTTSPL